MQKVFCVLPDTIADRLKSLGIEAPRLAGIAGVDESSAYRWLSGASKPYRKNVYAIADAARVSRDWLWKGEGDRDEYRHGVPLSRGGEPPAPHPRNSRRHVVYDPEHVPEGFTVVQYARHGHGAGIGRDNGDAPVQVLVPTVEVERIVGSSQPGPITKSFAAGPSMEPWIGDGEAIWYIPFGNFVDGARYALWIDGGEGDVVKRVYRRGDTLILKGDNRKIDPLTVTAGRAIDDYCEENVYTDDAGRTVRIEFRGRVVYPFDRAPAVLAELAEFARSLMRD